MVITSESWIITCRSVAYGCCPNNFGSIEIKTYYSVFLVAADDAECKLKMALPLFNIFSSICTMVLMSFDRVRVIAQGQTSKKHHAIVAVILTWVFSLVLTAPQFYEYQLLEKWEEEENETELACTSAGKLCRSTWWGGGGEEGLVGVGVHGRSIERQRNVRRGKPTKKAQLALISQTNKLKRRGSSTGRETGGRGIQNKAGKQFHW